MATIAEQIACVEREIGMRERVYPRRVSDKKMSQAKADQEIATMRAVLATLKGLEPSKLDDTLKRCTTCGFIVDTKFEAVFPR